MNLLYRIPGQPPVNVQTNTKGVMAWFTQQHVVGLLVAAICVALVMSFWKMIKGHPILLVIVVFIAVAAAGYISFKHPSGAAPPPVVPLPKGH